MGYQRYVPSILQILNISKMKKFKYIVLAMAGAIFSSCMGSDYADPSIDETPYGNNEIQTTNLVTISQLKNEYKTLIQNSAFTQITTPMQIKGIVTGNDKGGNLYQEISVQDSTGAILVAVSASGIYGYLPEGQEVLIDVDSLYIGGYGQMPEIGGIYTNTSTGAQSIGRMDRYTWQKHFKIIGEADTTKLSSMTQTFDPSQMGNANYIWNNAGKLMTIKNVSFRDGNGIYVFAPNDGSVSLTSNCANRGFKGYNTSDICLRTSTYADFANDTIPTYSCNVTGVFTIYNKSYNTWQILARSLKDIRKYSK